MTEWKWLPYINERTEGLNKIFLWLYLLLCTLSSRFFELKLILQNFINFAPKSTGIFLVTDCFFTSVSEQKVML